MSDHSSEVVIHGKTERVLYCTIAFWSAEESFDELAEQENQYIALGYEPVGLPMHFNNLLIQKMIKRS